MSNKTHMPGCASFECQICGDPMDKHAELNITKGRFHVGVPAGCDCETKATMTPTQFDKEVKSRLDDFMSDLAAENKSWLDIPLDGRLYALALFRVWNGQSDEGDEGTLEEMWRSARQEYLIANAEANMESFMESRND